VLNDIAREAFGPGVVLINAAEARKRRAAGSGLSGNEVAVFGRYWGGELPLPRPPTGKKKGSAYYVDWVLSKLDSKGELVEFTAVEVQTIDTTGIYLAQAQTLMSGRPYTDKKGRAPGFSDAGLNWENVNKRILPQLIYKGQVLRRESRCTKGLFFVCP